MEIFLKTVNLRSRCIEDSLSMKCDSLIQKIRMSNKFYNKNAHEKRSFMDIFSKFIVDESSDEEDIAKKRKKFQLELH